MTRALILAEGFRLQYRVLRCAAECFDQVYVLGSGEARKLKRSRYCTEYFHCTGPLDSLFADRHSGVRELMEDHQINFILPSCSDTTRLLTIFGRDLKIPHYPVPDFETFEALSCRGEFNVICRNLGFPTPKTRNFASAGDLYEAAQLGELTFPLTTEPFWIQGGSRTHKFDNVEQIPMDLGYAPILCQDFVAGTSQRAFYLCWGGRILESFAYCQANSGVAGIDVPDVDVLARTLVDHLGYDGIIGFDVRRKPDGSFVFIECNPHFWHCMDVAMVSGVNFVELGYRIRQDATPRARQFHVRSPAKLLGNAIRPWSLNTVERAYLSYLGRDIGALTRAALEGAFLSGQVRGQPF